MESTGQKKNTKGSPKILLEKGYFSKGAKITAYTKDECCFTDGLAHSPSRERCIYYKTCHFKGFGIIESPYWICSKLVILPSKLERILEEL